MSMPKSWWCEDCERWVRIDLWCHKGHHTWFKKPPEELRTGDKCECGHKRFTSEDVARIHSHKQFINKQLI